uniref:Uncharacterized protein n=1 Tax=Cacopsylla melanoneura TaxID=428564 RepID=A0A8D9DZW5_9HEMI
MDSDENDGNPKTGSTKVTTKSRGRQKKKGSQTKTKGSSRLNVQDRLSDKVQDELIRQVEKRPAMYDPDHKDNGRKQTITYWDSIADEIRDLTGENIGVNSRRRFTNASSARLNSGTNISSGFTWKRITRPLRVTRAPNVRPSSRTTIC